MAAKTVEFLEPSPAYAALAQAIRDQLTVHPDSSYVEDGRELLDLARTPQGDELALGMPLLDLGERYLGRPTVTIFDNQHTRRKVREVAHVTILSESEGAHGLVLTDMGDVWSRRERRALEEPEIVAAAKRVSPYSQPRA